MKQACIVLCFAVVAAILVADCAAQGIGQGVEILFSTYSNSECTMLLLAPSIVTSDICYYSSEFSAYFYATASSQTATEISGGFACLSNCTGCASISTVAQGQCTLVPGTTTYFTATIVQYWTVTGSLTYVRYDHTATQLSNGNVLVAGGYGTAGYLNSAELYNAATGLWTVTGSLIYARFYHTATLLSNGNVLVAGGNGFYGNLNNAEVYNATTGVWTLAGSLTYARYWHTATLLPNGNVLVASGKDNNNNPTNSAEFFNATTGVWNVTGSLTYARYWHTATLLPNGNVLVAGGDSFGNTAELYNAAIGVWTVTASLTYARYFHTATLLPNGNVLVAGGDDNGVYQYSYLNSAEVYNPTTGIWIVTGNLAYARWQHTATLLLNGNVLIAGGFNRNNGYLNSAELYNTTTGVWTLTGSLRFARCLHTATLLSNGNVLVDAGYYYGENLNSAELYITTNPTALPGSLGCCSVSQGVYSEMSLSSNLQVTCTNCDNTVTTLGNFSNVDFYNFNFISISLNCTNCSGLVDLGLFDPKVLLPSISLVCTNCPSLQSLGNFSFATSIASSVSLSCTNCNLLQSLGEFTSLNTSPQVNLSCTNCSSLESLGQFPLLNTNSPIVLSCSNCPNIANTLFPSLPTSQSATSVIFTCNSCPSPSFAITEPIVFVFAGTVPTVFSTIAPLASVLFSNAILPNNLTFVNVVRMQTLSFVNISGLTNLDFLAGLNRVDGSITVQNTSFMNIDGLTTSLSLVGSATVINNPMLCNINVNKFETASNNQPLISNNGFETTCQALQLVPPSAPIVMSQTSTSIQLTWNLPTQPSISTIYSLTVNGAAFLTFPSWNPVASPYNLTYLSPSTPYVLNFIATLGVASFSSPSVTITTDSTCPSGYYHQPSQPTSCLACGIAQFPSLDLLSCVSCPSGTYANASTLASSASCQLCPSGTYSSGQATQCSSCPSHYCPFGAAAALSSTIYSSPANVSIASSSTSNSLSRGYAYVIVFFLLAFVSVLVVWFFRKPMRSIILKFSWLISAPMFLFRVNEKDGTLLEMPSTFRGLIGFLVSLGLILETAFQINNFVVNQFASLSTIQPGTTFSSGLSALSATTITNIIIVLFASPITCDASSFSPLSTINGTVSCTSNTTTTTFILTTTLSPLPSTATNFQLTITAANGNLAYAPALQYSFTSLCYNNLNYSFTETIVGGSDSVVTGTTTINIAAVATESLDVNGATLNTGYDFSYISTSASTSNSASSSLVLSFQLSVPQYFLQVRQVVAITPLDFLSNLLAIGSGVISVGSLTILLILSFRKWLREGLSAEEESGIDLADR